MEDLKKLKIKYWKEITKERRTWRETGLRGRKPTEGCSAK
jgi:hypothetical protein